MEDEGKRPWDNFWVTDKTDFEMSGNGLADGVYEADTDPGWPRG